jgi:hypothetical protein
LSGTEEFERSAMKQGLLTAGLILMFASPVLADVNSMSVDQARAEKAALAELLSARIKSALEGEAYTLDKSCDAEAECTISIRP